MMARGRNGPPVRNWLSIAPGKAVSKICGARSSLTERPGRHSRGVCLCTGQNERFVGKPTCKQNGVTDFVAALQLKPLFLNAFSNKGQRSTNPSVSEFYVLL